MTKKLPKVTKTIKVDENLYYRIVKEKGDKTFNEYFDERTPMSKKEISDHSISDLNQVSSRIINSPRINFSENMLLDIFETFKRISVRIIFDQGLDDLLEDIINLLSKVKTSTKGVK